MSMFYTIHQQLKITGRYRIRQGNKILAEGKNVITNTGLKLILQRLCNSQLFPRFIEIGTHDWSGSPTDPLPTDTTIEQAIAGATVDVGGGRMEFHDDARQVMVGRDRNVTTGKNRALLEFIADWGGIENTNVDGKEITEAGVFNRYKLGSMLSHFKTFPVVTIKPSLPYSVDWELDMEMSEDISISGGIVFTGMDILSNVILQKQNDFDNIQNQEVLDYSCTHIGVGTGTKPVNVNDIDLDSPTPGENGLRRITGFSIDESDVNKPILHLQRYINEFMFNVDQTEVGLFNVREESYQDGIKGQRTQIQQMFGRAVLLTPIPANTEILINFKISVERGT